MTDRSHERAVEGEAAAIWVAIEKLTPWVKNPRKNDRSVDKAVASIKEHGWGAPILARKDTGEIIAGHTRLKAALRMGMALVPVRYMDLDEIRAHSLALADNRVGEDSEWDKDALARVLLELEEAGAKLEATAFEQKELDDLMARLEAERLGAVGEDLDEDLLALPAAPASIEGGVYTLGPHILVCGDSTRVDHVDMAMGGVLADLLWTDPPYNVDYGALVEAMPSRGAKARRELGGGSHIANDKMDDASFRQFLRDALSAADAVMRAGAAFYVAHADTEGFNFRGAVRDVAWHLSSTIVWRKDALVMGRADYHWRHEPILYGWKEGGSHFWCGDRTQDTIWDVDRPKKSEAHPTMKPVELVARAIRNSTRAGEHVLDLFGGSGTTLVACAKEQRVAHLVEKDPKYCDVIRRRWARFASKAGLAIGDGLVGAQYAASEPAEPASPLRRRGVGAPPEPLETAGDPARIPDGKLPN